MANGIEVPSTKNYMIDRNGTVYAYIEALDVAVESEILMAATSNGHEILFIRHNAADIRITTYDEITTRVDA